MQKSLKKSLLRKFILEQCQKKNRKPLPLEALSLTITIPPILHPQPREIETPNPDHNEALTNAR